MGVQGNEGAREWEGKGMGGQGNGWAREWVGDLAVVRNVHLPFIPLPTHSLARPFCAPVQTASSTRHVYPNLQMRDNAGCLGTSTKRAARWTAPPFPVASILEVDHDCIVF